MTIYSPTVLALIPARSGSKSIPDKNVREFCGKPLLAHSIEQARACSLVQRVIVSTDSERYALIAREYGAETPFLRPVSISGDHSTDLEVFQHALHWLAENEGTVPSIIVHLRPTYPNRKPDDIAAVVQLLLEHAEWDSVRSITPAIETPYKMWFHQEDGTLKPVITTDIREAHSLPRQQLPATFLQNACVDAIRSATVLEKGSIAGNVIGAYIMQDCHDIDTPQQFAEAALAFRCQQGMPIGKTFVIDIDGVIATLVPENDYSHAAPISENIRRINRLHVAGNRVILFTARGFVTGKDWSETTRRQLSEWGVMYDDLRFGKPAADFYVDDRMLSLAELALLDEVPDGPRPRTEEHEISQRSF